MGELRFWPERLPSAVDQCQSRCLPCFSASIVTGLRSLSRRCLNRLCSTSNCCSPATSIASILRSGGGERERMNGGRWGVDYNCVIISMFSSFISLSEVTAVRLTGTGHVREDDVDVDFQFVSSRRVDVQLRMNLRGTKEKFRHSVKTQAGLTERRISTKHLDKATEN